MARVICPFCCNVHDFTKSQQCLRHSEWEVPSSFIKNYDAFPPIWLPTVGFERYGKSTYLSALTLLLSRMGQVIPSLWYQPLDKYTYDEIQKMRALDDKVPPPTSASLPLRPLLFRVGDMGPLGSRCLVLHDVPGEIFKAPEKVGENVPALREASTVWFLISLPNLEKDKRTINDLLMVYLSGMEDLKSDVRGWNLIVIYTKADIVTRFPNDLQEYFLNDPLTQVARGEAFGDIKGFDIGSYLEKMTSISEQLEEFTATQVEGGKSFINLAKAKGMNLVFSLVSALGHQPDNENKLQYEKSPRRVLDPFLWALTLERKRKARSLRLIVDTAWQNANLSKGTVADLWGSLNKDGEVTTHALGQLRPVSASGQSPPESFGGRKRQRLLGPILQTCSPEDRVMVFTGGPIFDLADFQSTDWSDRLLIVSTEDELSFDWSHTEICRSSEDMGFLVDRLLNLGT